LSIESPTSAPNIDGNPKCPEILQQHLCIEQIRITKSFSQSAGFGLHVRYLSEWILTITLWTRHRSVPISK
jgi:hypothetical protein